MSLCRCLCKDVFIIAGLNLKDILLLIFDKNMEIYLLHYKLEVKKQTPLIYESFIKIGSIFKNKWSINISISFHLFITQTQKYPFNLNHLVVITCKNGSSCYVGYQHPLKIKIWDRKKWNKELIIFTEADQKLNKCRRGTSDTMGIRYSPPL